MISKKRRGFGIQFMQLLHALRAHPNNRYMDPSSTGCNRSHHYLRTSHNMFSGVRWLSSSSPSSSSSSSSSSSLSPPPPPPPPSPSMSAAATSHACHYEMIVQYPYIFFTEIRAGRGPMRKLLETFLGSGERRARFIIATTFCLQTLYEGNLSAQWAWTQECSSHSTRNWSSSVLRYKPWEIQMITFGDLIRSSSSSCVAH